MRPEIRTIGRASFGLLARWAPSLAAQIANHVARLYVEDPAQGFIPSTGRLVHLRLPEAAVDLRVETGVGAGDEVTSFYDPMIAKLVAWGPERDTARRRLVRAAGIGPGPRGRRRLALGNQWLGLRHVGSARF